MTVTTSLPSARRCLAPAAGVLAVVGLVVGLTAAGSPDVTRARVERSLTPSFTRLYVDQQRVLGHEVPAASVAARSACDRGGPQVADVGAGADWICLVDFTDQTGVHQQGKFELQVHANACYTAAGPAKLLGGFTILDTRGRDVTNPLSAFDVCFDPDA